MRFTPKHRILGSVSGGRSSWEMVPRILKLCPDHDILWTFANTGREDERTLRFNVQCAEYFGIKLHWLEAKVNSESGVGTTYTETDFDHACRNGEPFEAVIKKYGIPNKAYPHCTRELKINPMHAFAKDHWGTDDYTTAIGYRADEQHRVNAKWREMGFWYPLIEDGVIKSTVRTRWMARPFDLDLPEHHGNCGDCQKKSLRKLLTIAKHSPEIIEWRGRMEREHGRCGAGTEAGPRVSYRDNRSAADLLIEATRPFVEFVPQPFQTGLLGWLETAHEIDELDREDDCGSDSCEAA